MEICIFSFIITDIMSINVSRKELRGEASGEDGEIKSIFRLAATYF